MPGITVDTSLYKASRYIDGATSGLGNAMIIGAALMTVALMLSFMAIRPAILAIAAIALSITAALLVLYVRESQSMSCISSVWRRRFRRWSTAL